MFQMTVTDVLKVHNNLISVAGPCLNKDKFTSRLVDNDGNVYEAHIPFDKTLVLDDSKIMLGIFGKYEIESLKGRILKGL